MASLISEEQFGFLKGQLIHDVVAIEQEAMHSIHTYKMETLIMNLDIFKAYDYVDWSFITLIILKVGLSLENIRWIMACITSVRYAVIINGLPTNFFVVLFFESFFCFYGKKINCNQSITIFLDL